MLSSRESKVSRFDGLTAFDELKLVDLDQALLLMRRVKTLYTYSKITSPSIPNTTSTTSYQSHFYVFSNRFLERKRVVCVSDRRSAVNPVCTHRSPFS
jgi:hypothetical protein